MKKFLLLAAVAIIGLGASAEDINIKIDTSKVFVGGNIGVWHDSNKDMTTATILPEVGYNINKTWTVGTQIGYQYVGNSDAHNNAFVFTPYARWTYYSAGMVSLFVDGGVDLYLGNTAGKGVHSDTAVGYGVGLKPGVALNVHKNVSIVAHFGKLGYYGTNDAGKGFYESGYGFMFGNALNFGFYYNF